MIDSQGYRLNVGIILANAAGRLFWGKRVGHDAWQFPQGGVDSYETLEETLYRELAEEVGLCSEDVELLGVTRRWLYYDLPPRFQRRHQKPLCIGQRQKWFLLRLLSSEDKIRFDANGSPEFDDFRWVDYWHPPEQVISFKQEIYRSALGELEPLLFSERQTVLADDLA